MAEEQKKVIIDFETNIGELSEKIKDTSNNVALLTQKQSELKKAIKEGNGDIAELEVQLKGTTNELKEQKKALDAYTGEMVATSKKVNEMGTSLKEMQARLTTLKDAYASLTAEERKSAKGKELLTKIQTLDKEVKGISGSIGNFQSNVGNYMSALDGMSGGLISSLKGVGAQLMALIATPVGAVIAGIAGAVALLKKGFEGNREALRGLQSGMALFTPILDAVKRGLEAVATWVGNVVDKFAGWVGSWSKSVAQARELTKAEQAMEDASLKASEARSKAEAAISELRLKAEDKVKYTAEERLKFLEQIKNIEGKVLNMNIKEAEAQLRLHEEEGKRSANDQAWYEKKTELINKVSQARKAYNDHLRETTNKYNEIKNGVNKAVETEEQALARVQAERLKNQKKWEDEYNKSLERMGLKTSDLQELATDGQKKLLSSLTDSINAGMASIAEQRKQLYGEQDEQRKKDVEQEQAWQSQKTDIVIQGTMNALGAITELQQQLSENRIAEAEAEFNKDIERLNELKEAKVISEEEYNKAVADATKKRNKEVNDAEKKAFNANKVNQIANVLVSTALAIMQAFAQLGPIGGAVSSALIGATSAVQIATISAQKFTPKYSRGGDIVGNSHAQGGVLIEAEGGEAVMTKKAVARYAPLLSYLNKSVGGSEIRGASGKFKFATGGVVGGSAGYEDLKDVMLQVASRPVYVAVKDINEGQENYAKVVGV